LNGERPVHLAAIDAGSNAIRLLIARAASPDDIRILKAERCAVRLGHNVFVRGSFDRQTMRRAVKVFAHFRALLERYHVASYRAVATSAAREARNRRLLVDRIFAKTGIALEVIDGQEEARLEVLAVLSAIAPRSAPRLVLDLGGGSLELICLHDGRPRRSIQMPIGTVRILEQMGINGSIGKTRADEVRRLVLDAMDRAVPRSLLGVRGLVAACGGNAETLARLMPGRTMAGQATLDLKTLRRELGDVLRLDVGGRMRAFGVRRDRAEVLGIAAIVLDAIGSRLGASAFVVPGVGIRDGIVRELVEARKSRTADEDAHPLLSGARALTRRFEADPGHGEQVKRLAGAIFDQLRDVHGMGAKERKLLEAGAILHDVGHFVNDVRHHAHGAYLVRNSVMPGIAAWRRDMLACLVRYHNNKTRPRASHAEYTELSPGRRRQVRMLAAILRIAEGLDRDHKGSVWRVRVDVDGNEAEFRIYGANGSAQLLEESRRKAQLFQEVFGLRARFRKAGEKRQLKGGKVA